MRILSCFDGISCGRVALERAGIPVSQYIASEVDKHAITVSKANYPDILHLDDVRVVRQMAEADVFGKIDLVMGGSPCQGFSFAGKQLAFNDPRSALFFEFVAIIKALKQHNPELRFLLENVKMRKEHLAVITEMLGVEPILINSALVSAQNRQRWYWCNWAVEQPEDRGIALRDIIEHNVADINSEGWHKWFNENKDFQLRKKYSAILSPEDKAITMTARQYASYNGNFVPVNYSSSGRGNGVVESRQYLADKAHTLTAAGYSQRSATVVVGRLVGRNIVDGKRKDYLGAPTEQRLELRDDEKTNCLTTVSKDNVLVKAPEKYLPDEITTGFVDPYNKKCVSGDKSTTLRTNSSNGNMWVADEQPMTWRNLTPVECERLQTLPDGYTSSVSKTQRYKMLGNGWTVDVIAHILRGMPR